MRVAPADLGKSGEHLMSPTYSNHTVDSSSTVHSNAQYIYSASISVEVFITSELYLQFYDLQALHVPRSSNKMFGYQKERW
jgi:hypothetical protein